MADAKGRAGALTLRSDANLRCSSNLPTIRSLCNTWNGRRYFAGSQSYFTSLKLPAPALFTWVTLVLELLVSAGLILGIGTRYAAILMFVFVVVATAIGHRYWEYPVGPQQIGQYNNFLKNISIMGGALAIFVTGAGRFFTGSHTG
jgi:putative oxidoreductase